MLNSFPVNVTHPIGREKWLVVGEKVRLRFYKFAFRRPVSQQFVEDVFQDVLTDLVTNRDTQEEFGDAAVRSFVLTKLKGALRDRIRETDPFSRKVRVEIQYILSKVRSNKTLGQVLKEEGVSEKQWKEWNTPKPKDYELGWKGDILTPIRDSDSSSNTSNAFMDHVLGKQNHFEADELEEEESLFSEKVKAFVSAFFESLNLEAKFIIYSYFLLNKNMHAVGLFLGITGSGISRKLTEYFEEKPQMLQVLTILKTMEPQDSFTYDALLELRKEILALIKEELEPERIAALDEFLAEESEKCGQDLLAVLKSVSSSLHKTTL